MQGHQAISDYAIIGDCRTAALVSSSGSIDWLCLPEFSGPSVFGAILDPERGGRFSIRPSARFRSSRRYVGDTNVLETTFQTDSGAIRLTDCFPIPDEEDRMNRLQPQREVLRIVEGLEGAVSTRVLFEPVMDYGRKSVPLTQRGRLGWGCARGQEIMHLHTNAPLEPVSGQTALQGEPTLRPGEKFYFSLTYEKMGMGIILPLGAAADLRLEETCRWWEKWVEQCTYEGPYRNAVIRSVLTLKLCTFSPSGAVVAAPTTSLPEAIGGIRNWDYRYCWLRDAALTFRAFFDLGYPDEGAAFIEWLLHATALTQPRLQVVYDVYGNAKLPEQELDHLSGYRNSRPVRVGNGAHDQLQLDIYGAVVLAANDYVMRGGKLSRQEAKLLNGFGRIICRQWRQADQSIWEIRSGGRHHTYSAFMCWVALNCLLMMHEDGVMQVPHTLFRNERKAIREAIETRGFNTRLNSYVDTFDGEEVDASLLRMGCHGYRAPNDPRITATFERVRKELGHNGLLMRYRPGLDGLPPGEGAFGICSFWAADLLAKQGELGEAGRLFDHLLGFANDVGLYAEEIDPTSGELLGNFPQAFTHIGLLTAAQSIAWRRS